MEERTCLRCGNADPEYFWNDEGVWYCRRCIAFGRIDAGQRPIPPKWEKRVIHCEYHLKYPLTAAQKRTVDEVMEGLNGGHDVLIYAATGAGKTELTMEAIRRQIGAAIDVVVQVKRWRGGYRRIESITAVEGFSDGNVTRNELFHWEGSPENGRHVATGYQPARLKEKILDADAEYDPRWFEGGVW